MINVVHLHPMLVHFPIVLFMCAVAMQVYVVAGKGDLAAAECLPRMAFGALLLGTVAAFAAAALGDLALEHAVEIGFPKAELEEHEELGFATAWLFAVVTVLHLGARWKGIRLDGGKGWILALAGLAGVVLMVIAAAHGGELVYELGVNVTPVKP
ncbi:MAG: hypothetical protein HZA24_06950 [Nitrospirae bacterium]|nr:hypothetical protein [Nitrospirota bacterium]